PPLAREPASPLVAAGGKRLRPTLVLIAGHTGDPAEPRLTGAAVAIELTHLSSLYHDDVMDEAELRRGMRPANARCAGAGVGTRPPPPAQPVPRRRHGRGRAAPGHALGQRPLRQQGGRAH